MHNLGVVACLIPTCVSNRLVDMATKVALIAQGAKSCLNSFHVYRLWQLFLFSMNDERVMHHDPNLPPGWYRKVKCKPSAPQLNTASSYVVDIYR